MNNTIKILKNPKKVFFSGCLHVNHDKKFLYEPRGFKSIHEHDAYLWTELEKLDSEDILINLGDTVLTANHDENFERLSKLACQQYHLFGNHQSENRLYKRIVREFWENLWAEKPNDNFTDVKNGDYKEIYPFKYNNLTFLGNYATFKINKQLVIANHFAQLIWDKMQHSGGGIHLCSHSHGNCELINENAEGKVLDIGVENAIRLVGRPYFNFVEIMAIMEKKKVKTYDHHN